MAGPSFLEHGGKRILRLDYAGLGPAEIVALMREAEPVIAAEPRRSVRLLSIAFGIRVTAEVVDALKAFALHNEPFVLASAIVGATAFQRATIALTITSRGRLSVDTFDEEAQAKDWLATM